MRHSNATISALDLAHIWHPCTQMKDHETLPIIPIQRASGVSVFDFDGKEYIDCISSWWVNLFGHCNPRINAAIQEQLGSLEHVLLAGFTHEPITRLSQRLCALTPHKLNKCFYADNGSSAIEVALKMSFHYHYNHTAPNPAKRTKFLSLTNAYHGETSAALSVGDLGLYRAIYEPILLEHITTPVPQVYAIKLDSSTGSVDSSVIYEPANIDSSVYYERELRELESILQKDGENICAFILEPLVQCAGAMHIYPKAFVKAACELCRQYGILIIFDEIAVGFGRTGSMFALEQCGVVPDFLCLSKGITGGYMPLSVVITSDEIYQAFYAPYEDNKAFLHSHSYTGNALACAAANAVLDIFASDDVIVTNTKLSDTIASLWRSLTEYEIVTNLRYCGMIFAFDVKITPHLLKKIHNERFAKYICQKALEKGLLLRPLGSTIYFMPPYTISIEQVKYVITRIGEIIHELS